MSLAQRIIRRTTQAASLNVMDYSWWGIGPQIPFVIVCLDGISRVYMPPPGVAIAILGLASALMAVRAVHNWSITEKVVWIAICFGLLSLELMSIYNDREQHDIEQTRIIREENEQFERVLTLNQKHFDKTLAEMSELGSLSKQAINVSGTALKQMTGGGQFCFLDAGFSAKSPTGKLVFRVYVYNSGPLPLDVCHVSVQDNSPINSIEDAQRNMRAVFEKQLGPLPPTREGNENGIRGFLTDFIAQEGSYYVHINTRNNRFYETLTLQSNGLSSIEIRNEAWKLVYSHHP